MGTLILIFASVEHMQQKTYPDQLADTVGARVKNVQHLRKFVSGFGTASVTRAKLVRGSEARLAPEPSSQTCAVRYGSWDRCGCGCQCGTHSLLSLVDWVSQPLLKGCDWERPLITAFLIVEPFWHPFELGYLLN